MILIQKDQIFAIDALVPQDSKHGKALLNWYLKVIHTMYDEHWHLPVLGVAAWATFVVHSPVLATSFSPVLLNS